MFECAENKGNKMDIDSQDGEVMITIYSKEMRCELVMCLSKNDTEKFKQAVSQI